MAFERNPVDDKTLLVTARHEAMMKARHAHTPDEIISNEAKYLEEIERARQIGDIRRVAAAGAALRVHDEIVAGIR